jgi:hypothetical protein
LQEGRENANIDAGLGFIWRISAYTRWIEAAEARLDAGKAASSGGARIWLRTGLSNRIRGCTPRRRKITPNGPEIRRMSV